MINEIGEVIILLQRPNAIRFNQNLFRSEWIHVGFDDEPICLVRKDWREVIEECTRRPYFDSGKILQWKKPVFNNFSNYLQILAGGGMRLLASLCWCCRPHISPPIMMREMSAATESQRWYLRSHWGLLEEFRWRMVCDQEVLALITDKLETVSQ